MFIHVIYDAGLAYNKKNTREKFGGCASQKSNSKNSPGSFFVLNDALVIMDFDTVTVVVDGVKATEMPIGPSLG